MENFMLHFQISYLRECGPDRECNPEVSISNARLDFPRLPFLEFLNFIYLLIGN